MFQNRGGIQHNIFRKLDLSLQSLSQGQGQKTLIPVTSITPTLLTLLDTLADIFRLDLKGFQHISFYT